MSRWDPEPTDLQRWIVRHRRWIRVVPALGLVATIFSAVLTVTNGLEVTTVFLAVSGLLVSLSTPHLIRDLTAFVEKDDRDRRETGDSNTS